LNSLFAKDVNLTDKKVQHLAHQFGKLPSRKGVVSKEEGKSWVTDNGLE
jgi:hypothetical protein